MAQTPTRKPTLRLPRGMSREVLEDRTCSETIAAAGDVHQALGPWHATTTYVNALAVEIAARGLVAHRNASLSVVYRGRVVGAVEADLLVDERLLVLVRADQALTGADRVEMMRGLAASDVRLGLVFNFGLPELFFARVC